MEFFLLTNTLNICQVNFEKLWEEKNTKIVCVKDAKADREIKWICINELIFLNCIF